MGGGDSGDSGGGGAVVVKMNVEMKRLDESKSVQGRVKQ